LGLQFLQVFIALIPGELLETAAGYAFGPWMGTLLCYLGVAVASALVFLLTRRFGTKLVEVFISREKINELRFINTEQKRNSLIFLLFFIPGTPKDLLTYFVGLTDIKLSTFLVISLIARLPSVLSSTFGGHLLGEGEYWGALILYGSTALVSGIGLLIYNAILRRKQPAEKV
ncbi:MAG: TVP38/TMEM64 family protein, partial [Oscillospiraceae bacterium]|nr:TVP38/TMEM64 family protein [Oscillospiraceae bacterium]